MKEKILTEKEDVNTYNIWESTPREFEITLGTANQSIMLGIGELAKVKCPICQNEVSGVVNISNGEQNIVICQECYNVIQVGVLAEILKTLNPEIIGNLIAWLDHIKPKSTTWWAASID